VESLIWGAVTMSQMFNELVYLGVVEVSVGFVLYLFMRGE
jgi:hypothetical protein